MKTVHTISGIFVLLLLQSAATAAPGPSLDIRRAVPDDVFLVVYTKHNPERDYQQAYYQDVWKTVQDTHVIERAVKIITSRMRDEDLQQAKRVLDELHTAVKPIDLQAICNAKEFIYAQQMKIPTPQYLVIFRMTPDAASATSQGITNLFKLVEKYIGKGVAIDVSHTGKATVTSLSLGPQVPFSPTVVTLNDIVLVASQTELARHSLALLTGSNGTSKFDDPRLIAALKKLPEPEDALVFYDGRRQMDDLRQFGPFIQAASHNNPQAQRVIKLINTTINQFGVLDYAVTVDYTEGNLNRSASYTRFLPNSENSLLRKMLFHNKPFAEWQSWVPAGALSYSLCTGVYLHPLYAKVLAVLHEDFPETKDALDQFEQIQTKLDVHLDADILQAFSGKYVSISLPSTSPLGGNSSVLALQCNKPKRIRQLLHRAIDTLSNIPALKVQQIQLTKCQDLDGFEELSVMMLAGFGVRPVIGFQDGWMIIGSNAEAIQQVLAARAGKIDTVDKTEAFKQMKLDITGPVMSVKYTNLAANTRAMARTINQIGTFVPMLMAMAKAKADADKMKPIQEILALLPDIAKIVAKFDFLEASLSVSKPGDDPDTFVQQSVVLVRPVEKKTDAEQQK